MTFQTSRILLQCFGFPGLPQFMWGRGAKSVISWLLALSVMAVGTTVLFIPAQLPVSELPFTDTFSFATC